MRAKMTAKLCQASFIAGAILTPPTLRKTRQQAGKAARRSARDYVKMRERVRRVAEATGRPGQYTAIAVALAGQAAKDATNKWRALVDEAEAEVAGANADKFGLYPAPEPITITKEHVGNSA